MMKPGPKCSKVRPFLLAANPQPSERMVPKRKLDMVTEELSRARTIKLAIKTGAASSRKQMVIEIPDFPMEFYRVPKQERDNGISLEQWFQNFNNNPSVQKQPQTYHDWIPTRTVQLLSKVLTVIGNNFGKVVVTIDDLLSCRLVSKSWKQSIDQFFHAVPLEPTICTETKLMKVISRIRSDNYPSVLDMLGSLERNKLSGTSTPFPSGHLSIEISRSLEKRYQLAFKNALEILLEFHGGSVQSFTFMDCSSDPDISAMCRWLKQMPNLKALQINLPLIKAGHDSPIPVDSLELPQLVTFVGFCVPERITEQMLSVNPQIQNLSVDSSQLQWSKLNQLILKCLSIGEISETQLSSLEALQSPLEKLRLTDDCDGDGVNLEKVFHMLSKYEGTLKELYLNLTVTDNRDNLNLRLSRLQHLSLWLWDSAPLNQKSFDFLLPLERLESLEIGLMPGEGNGRETDVSQVIELIGYFERLYESNVWKLLPRLKKVKIMGEFGHDQSQKVFTYTRDKLPGKSNGKK